MTIKIEREAVLYVLSRPPPSSLPFPTPYQCCPKEDEAEIVVREPKENDVVLVPISPDRYNDPAQLLRKFVAAAGISDDSSRSSSSAIDDVDTDDESTESISAGAGARVRR